MSKRITSRDVDCAVCGARKGERCRGSAYSGRSARTVDYHTARRAAAPTAEPDPVDDHYATAAAIPREPAVIEYVNLTRGLLCGLDVPASRYLRIQSTWCEQKRWADVLLTLSPDLYFHAAQGHRCVVHDRSEKDRATRAQWQGLSWVRYACSVAWYGKAEPEYVRGGHRVDDYWAACWRDLPERVRTYVAWYGRWSVGSGVRLEPCRCREVEP